MFVFLARKGQPYNLPQVTAPNGSSTPLVAAAPSPLATQKIVVQSVAANTVKVNVGGPDVSATTGLELAPGDSATFELRDPSQIYVFGVGGTALIRPVYW